MSRSDVVIEHDNTDVVATLMLRRITGDPEEAALWTALDAAVDRAAARNVALTFRNVQHISSPGIGALVAFARRCREKHARLVVHDLCPSLDQVFRLIRLDALMEIARDDSAGGGGMS